MKQLQYQKDPKYQHKDGTCYCGDCLCGNCLCKPQPTKESYSKDLTSTYGQNYRRPSYNEPVLIKLPQYQERKASLSTHTIYQDEYQNKKLLFNENPIAKRTKDMSVPFCSVNQYQVDYIRKSIIPPQIIKPVNQIQLIPQVQDETSQYQKSYVRTQVDRTQFTNISMIMNKRLHAKNEKSIYLNSSYQETFKQKIAPRQQILPVQSSLLPFGLTNKGISYQTTNMQDYSTKDNYKCPAYQKLEKLIL
ncbi:hypothetical protein pb186bvf_020792 [Paramecium bursaria]